MLVDIISKPEQVIKRYSSDLEKIKQMLGEEKTRWTITRDQNITRESPKVIAHSVDRILFFIDSASIILDDSLSVALGWLNEASQLKMSANNNQERLQETQKMKLSGLLKVREKPIWATVFKGDTAVSLIDNQVLISFGIEDSREYLEVNKGNLITLGVIFVVLLGALLWLRFHSKSLSEDDIKLHATGIFIVSRPIAAAFMLTILWSLWSLPVMPYMLDKFFSVIFLIPFLFIFHGIVYRPLKWSFYYLFVLFLFVNFGPLFYLGSSRDRLIVIFESLAILIFLYWFLRKRKELKPDDRTSVLWYQFLNFVSPIFILGICAGIILNIVGYENINKLVTYGTLVSLMIGLILGTAYLVLRGLAFLFTTTNLGRSSNIIREQQESFLGFFDNVMWATTVAAWLYLTLDNFLIWDSLLAWGTEIWETGYTFGEMEVTIGGLISFFLIIILSWTLSRFIKLLLQEEILGRFDMPRGVPMAISSLTQYTLILVGFMVALAYVGFDLRNLGLLAGALGVGIGFGLQNVVGNFISGLILVFERPVTVGDIIKVDVYDGIVVSIGIRSSVIQQWDGSRIIVPNSDLISQKVLNWTMSRYERRFIITIYTPPGTDPALVMELMTKAAVSVENVLPAPAPKTYFKGIIDQALCFELFFWVTFDILDAQSEVHLAVHKMLKEAGVKVLLPRKLEVREDKEVADKTRTKGRTKPAIDP